jgi:RNA polymerase sigma-70 factor, ECF subfamily
MPMTDAELAALSQQGDLSAFSQLARRWDGRLYRFVRRMLDNDEDARDACQDAMMKAYQNIGRLRDPERFTAWLHHIALNLCRDRYRARGGRVTVSYEEGQPGEAELVEIAGSVPATDRAAERSGLAKVLQQVLDRLPPEQKAAILLREYQGLTSEEIGRITGVPATTVRTRIFYGLKSMRRMLREHGITEASFLKGDA